MWCPAAIMYIISLISSPCWLILGSAWQHTEQGPDPVRAARVKGDAAYVPQVAVQHLWSQGEDR